MSRFTGRQCRGAQAQARARRRAQAESRNQGSMLFGCGHRHGFEQSMRCAIAYASCPCGWASWLMPQPAGSLRTDRDELDRWHADCQDHDSWCEHAQGVA